MNNSTGSSSGNQSFTSNGTSSQNSRPPNGGNTGSSTVSTTAVQHHLALYGYILLFLFGYFGHINTIVIFLRKTLRSVSTSCLFICVAISNIMYLLVCIYDFLYIGIGLTPVSTETQANLANALCRCRSFVQSVAMCTSVWLLLAISIDRWLRIRYPFRVKELCTQKRVLCGAAFIVVCAVAFNSHLLLPALGNLSGTTVCGPIGNSNYSTFFRKVWGILFASLQTIVPTIGLLILTINMFLLLRAQQKHKQELSQGRRRAFLDRQILIIMLTSIVLFFSTQIPQGLFNILLSPVLNSRFTQTQALELASILSFVASIDYAATFYVHCLTSGLFRKEFCDMWSGFLKGRHRRVGVQQLPGITTKPDGTSKAADNQAIPLQEIGINPSVAVEH